MEFQNEGRQRGSMLKTPQDKPGTAAEGCTLVAYTLGMCTGPAAGQAVGTHRNSCCRSHSFQRTC